MLFGGIVLFQRKNEWLTAIDVSVCFTLHGTFNMHRNDGFCFSLGGRLMETKALLSPETRNDYYPSRTRTLETMLWELGIIISMVLVLNQDLFVSKRMRYFLSIYYVNFFSKVLIPLWKLYRILDPTPTGKD